MTLHLTTQELVFRHGKKDIIVILQILISILQFRVVLENQVSQEFLLRYYNVESEDGEVLFTYSRSYEG